MRDIWDANIRGPDFVWAATGAALEAFGRHPVVKRTDAPGAVMAKYADRPMDFADATLVRIAERLSTNVVFTIDHNDFETYRVDGRRFDIAPSRTS